MTTSEYVGTFPHDSELWHAARAAGIGASEIAAIVGLSPWESHFSLWHRKAGLIGPLEVNEQMSWGHYLEPAIAKRFADEHPDLLVKRTGTWRSRMRPWQLANPDRLAYPGKVPVEVKWAPYSDGWGESGSDEIPVYYRCQVQWQMDVMGAEFAYVAALVGSEYREYVIAYDPEDIEVLRKAGQEFMDSLAAGEPPDIDATAHTYRVLKERHPEIDGSDQEIDAALADWYRRSRRELAEAETDAGLAKNFVLAAAGTAKYVVHDGERIARRQPGRGGKVALYEVKPPTEPKTIREATT